MVFNTEGFFEVATESWSKERFEPRTTEFHSDALTD